MISIKPGVRLLGVKPEIVFAWPIAASVYERFACTCTVTSIGDSKHGTGSLHYKGYGLDLRLPSFYGKGKDIDTAVAGVLKDMLGPEFDVVLEKDHIHMEWDPKE